MNSEQLAKVAKTLEVPHDGDVKEQDQDLCFKILAAQSERLGLLFYEGVLEVLPDGYGFLRSPEHDYLQGPEDVFDPQPVHAAAYRRVRRFPPVWPRASISGGITHSAG